MVAESESEDPGLGIDSSDPDSESSAIKASKRMPSCDHEGDADWARDLGERSARVTATLWAGDEDEPSAASPSGEPPPLAPVGLAASSPGSKEEGDKGAAAADDDDADDDGSGSSSSARASSSSSFVTFSNAASLAHSAASLSAYRQFLHSHIGPNTRQDLQWSAGGTLSKMSRDMSHPLKAEPSPASARLS